MASPADEGARSGVAPMERSGIPDTASRRPPGFRWASAGLRQYRAPGIASPGSQRGFSYLIVLFIVAIMGAVLAATGVVWQQASRRDRERELLFAGDAYRKAIGRYVAKGGYPKTFEELLRDPRAPGVERHLRMLYRDPITGGTEWGVVRTPEGGIMGVYSLSTEKPVKTAGFRTPYQEFEGKTRYSDWRFVHAAAGQQAPGTPAAGAPGQPGQPGAPAQAQPGEPVDPNQPGQPQQPGQPPQPGQPQPGQPPQFGQLPQFGQPPQTAQPPGGQQGSQSTSPLTPFTPGASILTPFGGPAAGQPSQAGQPQPGQVRRPVQGQPPAQGQTPAQGQSPAPGQTPAQGQPDQPAAPPAQDQAPPPPDEPPRQPDPGAPDPGAPDPGAPDPGAPDPGAPDQTPDPGTIIIETPQDGGDGEAR